MAKSPSSSAQPRQFRPETLLVHGGTLRSDFREMSEALFLTQGYVYDSAEQAERRFNGEEPGFQYSRFSNPTISMFEQRMRLLEGAEDVRSCATGMAAVTASIIGYLSAGQHIVAAKAMFGSCRYIVEDLCPRFGIEFTLVDGADNDAWKQALRPNTRAFFFETPSNPTLEIIDIAAVSKIAHEAGAIVIVDNVFATPMQQKPLQHGADVVVYSATKHIDGQGRCLGGVVLGSSHLIRKYYHDYLRQTGPSLSPFNAWVLLKSLETLPLRVAAQTATAERIFRHLQGKRGIKTVSYCGSPDHPQADVIRRQMTGGGQIVTIVLDADKKAVFRFQNALQVIKISNNLGDAKSIVTHPATTTHQRLKPEARAELGISDGMLRLSVGLEAFEDLAEDLDHALAAAFD
ncbi:MAG: O-succinylhomoserine sulfhydrylase [Hyphomicrobiaceae bacterium]